MQKFIFILFIQTIHQCFATDLTCGDLKLVYNNNCDCADDSSSPNCLETISLAEWTTQTIKIEQNRQSIAAGAIGATGPAGAIGAEGATGPAGAIGATGPAGAIGAECTDNNLAAKTLCTSSDGTSKCHLPDLGFSGGGNIGIKTLTPADSAALDITSTDSGFLMPRMTKVQRKMITSPAVSLMVYQTDVSTGFYFYDGTEWRKLVSEPEPAPAQVGDIREQGVVFWIDPQDNNHGLVAAFSDANDNIINGWGCNENDLPNVPNIEYQDGAEIWGFGAEIGNGFSNTKFILQDCNQAGIAALGATSFGSDWFLPSIKELKEMYDNKEMLESKSGFHAFNSMNAYWSSTEESYLRAWILTARGEMGAENKGMLFSVRAVRAF